MKRVFLIVLDSFGIGAMKDSAQYGDVGVNTLRSIFGAEEWNIPNLEKLGLYAIEGVAEALGLDKTRLSSPIASTARLQERSRGKDTTVGHWEIAGICSEHPLPTYPDGFPEEIIGEFSRLTGRGVLCNKPYSGTEVIRDYGEEHLKTGDLIVYTSADSVFQIAAHEEKVLLEELYRYCRMARELLQGEFGVGRVIARPFIGDCAANFKRTGNRHDYSIMPPADTMLDQLKGTGKAVIGVGKISDIFAGKGLTESIPTKSNAEGIEVTLQLLERDFEGLAFVNLVEFDSVYGHRRDIPGYAKAISDFDKALPKMMEKLGVEDILMITADHGCDPGYLASTDHTREYVPFLMYGKALQATDYGTRKTFADIGATVLQYFGIRPAFEGRAMTMNFGGFREDE